MNNIDINDYDGIADTLYEFYKQSSLGDYMVERIKSRFYGNLAGDHITDFKELYAILEAGKHGPNNPIVTGDIDEASWIEKGPDEYTKVVAIQRYCSMADDNTHIFTLRDFGDDDDWVTFKCVTAWPRQISEYRDHRWGDHRDIKVPSINTFRKHKFKFGYDDGRDDHYCFKYDSMQGCVTDAHFKENRLLWALSSLRSGLNSVKLELE